MMKALTTPSLRRTSEPVRHNLDPNDDAPLFSPSTCLITPSALRTAILAQRTERTPDQVSIIIEWLEKLHGFPKACAGPEALAKAVQQCHGHLLYLHDAVYAARGTADCLYFVVRGRIAIFDTKDPLFGEVADVILSEHGSGEWIGENELLVGGTSCHAYMPCHAWHALGQWHSMGSGR